MRLRSSIQLLHCICQLVRIQDCEKLVDRLLGIARAGLDIGSNHMLRLLNRTQNLFLGTHDATSSSSLWSLFEPLISRYCPV